MFLRQGYIDESLMHSKGIVDLALFGSGLHIFTLKVFAVVLRKCGRRGLIEGSRYKIPSGIRFF